ncbi:unnamed protein product, partial [Effrenium voratum]
WQWAPQSSSRSSFVRFGQVFAAMFSLGSLRNPVKPPLCFADLSQIDPFSDDESAAPLPLPLALPLLTPRKESSDSVATASSGVSTTSSVSKHLQRRLARERELQHFLRKHQFTEVNKPRASSFTMFRERLWPIHVAAALGQARDVRLLLSAGAVADQKTSFGRRPVDIALEANQQGSHDEVLEILQGDVKLLAMREFWTLVQK